MSDYGSARRQAIMALRAVAALAEKLAEDLEGNRLWEGDYSRSMAEIQRHAADAGRVSLR